MYVLYHVNQHSALVLGSVVNQHEILGKVVRYIHLLLEKLVCFAKSRFRNLSTSKVNCCCTDNIF